ncbi:MAG: hypothetical protein QG552_1514 [Thermodesulfobacteriota bacterium]|nr:hypothetical protein [Thermodesulfobacteriota bacterium]
MRSHAEHGNEGSIQYPASNIQYHMGLFFVCFALFCGNIKIKGGLNDG